MACPLCQGGGDTFDCPDCGAIGCDYCAPEYNKETDGYVCPYCGRTDCIDQRDIVLQAMIERKATS